MCCSALQCVAVCYIAEALICTAPFPSRHTFICVNRDMYISLICTRDTTHSYIWHLELCIQYVHTRHNTQHRPTNIRIRIYAYMYIHVWVLYSYMYVCVCVRERERERNASSAAKFWKRDITPSTQCYLFRFWYAFSMLKLTKFPPPFGGDSTFTTHAMSWRGSFCTFTCTAPERVRKLFEFAEKRIDHLLQTFWDESSIFFSANRARHDSQKLPLNGFTEWIFIRNMEKAFQNRQ